ncbi:hypothetical protein J6590_018910 [Homalodisca vitripennis]|nr:hypothetical protein J6590_018910 [Homalodisca vitripennis]
MVYSKSYPNSNRSNNKTSVSPIARCARPIVSALVLTSAAAARCCLSVYRVIGPARLESLFMNR